ncbi:MAG: DUF1573 domain-containing protein [Candidatus Eisenbacteria bacterium]
MLKYLLIVSVLQLSLLPGVYGATSFDRTDADMGFIYRDEPQRLVFEFDNVSDNSLRILGIEPSCDCTSAQVVPETLGPRGHGKVLVFFDPMGYEGKGRFKEFVRIVTDDPSEPEVLLTFSAEVGIGPEPDPRALTFGKICRGGSDTLDLSLRAAPGELLKVLDAYSDTGCVIVEAVETGVRGEHEFRVIATNREGCGRVAGLVTILTTDSLRSEVRVPITLSLVGRIIVEPDIIAFGPTLPGTFVAQTVRIYSKDGFKFSIPNVSCSVENLEPVITPVSDSSCELRLMVKEGSPPGRVAGEITLETDCPDESPLDIRVTGYIRKGGK